MDRLKDKVVFITGSGSGIGRASAVLFGAEGAKVSVCDIDQLSGEETVSAITQNGGQAIFVKADLTNPGDAKDAIQKTVLEFGKLDVIYNNAGGSSDSDKPVDEIPIDVWNKGISINLNSAFYCCKYGIPHLIENGSGSVIMTGSVAGLVGWKRSSYTAAKGGIIALTKVMAVDYAKHNIRVNCICPGLIITDRTAKEARESPIFADDMRAMHLLGFGEPLDIANNALYLASDESKRVTGATFTVDSGYTAVGRIDNRDILTQVKSVTPV